MPYEGWEKSGHLLHQHTPAVISLLRRHARVHTRMHTCRLQANAPEGFRTQRSRLLLRAALTGFAGVFVVYGLCSLLFIIVVVRLFVLERVTNCHFAPESQAGKDQRDPAHLGGQCPGHSVHLKTELEKGPRSAADGRWSHQSARENSRRCANSADHCDGSLSSGSLELLCLVHGRSAPGRVGAVRSGVNQQSVRRVRCPPPRR